MLFIVLIASMYASISILDCYLYSAILSGSFSPEALQPGFYSLAVHSRMPNLLPRLIKKHNELIKENAENEGKGLIKLQSYNEQLKLWDFLLHLCNTMKNKEMQKA
ncbi:MAG: hypothetical protein ACRC46_06345 [Thermoguttaceae bacterium]